MENCASACTNMLEIYLLGLMLGIVVSPIVAGIHGHKNGFFDFEVLGIGLLIALSWPVVTLFGSLYWLGYGLAMLYSRCNDIVNGLISKAQEEEENEG